jgi:hypothetical protein
MTEQPLPLVFFRYGIQAVFDRHDAQGMQHFHFYDHIEVDQPENTINLQNWYK